MVGLQADIVRMGIGIGMFRLTEEFAGYGPAVYQSEFQHGLPTSLQDAAGSLTCVRTGVKGPRSAFVLSTYGPVLKDIFRREPLPEEETWPQSL